MFKRNMVTLLDDRIGKGMVPTQAGSTQTKILLKDNKLLKMALKW